MSESVYDKINNDAIMYKLLLNNQIIGGCRLETTQDCVLLGKIFIIASFRNLGLCTFMMNYVIPLYKHTKLSVWSYAHLQEYYSKFGFRPDSWFIKDLCMIMYKTPE
ncbi:hypothetical protein SS50377_24387 [Spironucleus salmonicida]|uniref:N-acetyltransferase domain-containing protein n=1 Tax=Spironucleus salmonicida TaxID=348837 RepID=V6LP95_9EUKA|nr:hypothetical protein SS50377_24387 [Spironucleus salmonicida]|eukprot:EST46063.1 Hypothetical protein SS50377_14053 [Spironucleus salmonicida]